LRPALRVARDRWFNLLWLLPIGFVCLIVAVAVAKGLRNTSPVEHFIARYHRNYRDGQRQGPRRAADLGRSATFLQPVLVDLHHPVRVADPQ
jgi:hypothetical protein